MQHRVFEGNWNQIRDQAKFWWSEITDDDLETVSGNYDKFIRVIQEKYGFSKKQAEYETVRRVYKGWFLEI